jgi:hypothetical protein
MDQAKNPILPTQFIDISNDGTRPLVGGLSMTQYHDTDEVEGAGTLGCIAKRKNSTQHVVLTCQHVLKSTGSKASPEADPKHLARQPARKCSSIFFHYENIVGPIVIGERNNVQYNGAQYWVDAAIANVNSGVHTSNEVQMIGALQGYEDLTPYVSNPASLPQNYAVQKTGRSTPLTHGVIYQLQPSMGIGNSTALNTIMVAPVPPYKTITASYQIDPSKKDAIIQTVKNEDPTNLVTITGSGDQLSFSMNVFAVEGDSGAVLVNAQQKVVGLICKASAVAIEIIDKFGDPGQAIIWTGMAIACHIEPVMQEMDIDLITGPETTAGNVLDLEDVELDQAGVELDRAEEAPDLETALSRAEADLRALSQGEELLEVIGKHGEEVRELVHHYRPVKVVWHRNQCPAFAVSIIDAVRDHLASFQREIKGIPITTAVAHLKQALLQYGSPALRHTLELYGGIVEEALSSCETYSDLLRFFRVRMAQPNNMLTA